MRTRSLRVKRSKGRVPQARKPPRRPRPSKPKRKPEKPRRSETGSSARTRGGCWATSETPSQDARDTVRLYRGPEPFRRFGLRPLHALANAELLRTPSQGELRRKTLPRTPVNKGKRRGAKL